MTSLEENKAPELVASAIQSITLFTNQAQVTRTAKTRIQKGVQEILIDVEAFHVDADSVSAKVFGQGEIYSVQYREVFLSQAPQENIFELEKKIEETTIAIKGLQKEMGVLDRRDDFLSSLVDFSQTEVPKTLKTAMPSVKQLEETLGFIETKATASNAKRQQLELQIVSLEKEQDTLERELASLCNQTDHSKHVIEVLFNASVDQEVDLEASYIVYEASWQPFYKIDVPMDLGEPNLTLFARIFQQTGENWLAARLAISNVIPMQGIGLPDQGVWTLDIHRPAPAAPRAAMARKRAASAHPEEKALDGELDECCEVVPVLSAPAPAPEAAFMQTEKTELPLAFEYSLPQPLDIDSQEKQTILPLFTKSIAGDFFHRVVPQSSTMAFLVCRAKADSELLSGYLNVYFGSRYIGKTHLEEKKAGEDFLFSLGADRQIKVKRETRKDKLKETLLGMVQRQSIVRKLAVSITLENLKDQPARVEVLDSIPVSRTDKIEVKEVELHPKPQTESYQDREGVLRWLIDLEPGEKRALSMRFTVVYPQKTGITGL